MIRMVLLVPVHISINVSLLYLSKKKQNMTWQWDQWKCSAHRTWYSGNKGRVLCIGKRRDCKETTPTRKPLHRYYPFYALLTAPGFSGDFASSVGLEVEDNRDAQGMQIIDVIPMTRTWANKELIPQRANVRRLRTMGGIQWDPPTNLVFSSHYFEPLH